MGLEVLARLWRKLTRRKQYKEFKEIYEQLVTAGYPTHKATVLDNHRDDFTGDIVGYSDDYLFLRHHNASVSSHNFYDVVSVDPIASDEVGRVAFSELYLEAVRVFSNPDNVVMFPGDYRWKNIDSVRTERTSVEARINVLSRTTNTRCVYLVLSPEFNFNRDSFYYPHELSRVHSGARNNV